MRDRQDDRAWPEAARRYLERSRSWAPWSWWAEAVGAVVTQMDQDSGHDWGHLWRVLANAHTLHERQAPGPEAPWPELAAAALLHDLVNLPKSDPRRGQASRLSAERAAALLAELDALSPLARQRVGGAIRRHSFSSGLVPQTTLDGLLADADRLDALGAVGIARVFAVSGLLDRPLFDPFDPFARQRPLDDERFGLDHFYLKILRLPELMRTEAGRALADERAAVLRQYLDALGAELGAQARLEPSEARNA